MIDKQALIKKYSSGDHPAIRLLFDGGEIIGDAVDENNRLYYVIQRGEIITVESAENQNVRFTRLQPQENIKVKVDIKSNG